MTFFLNAIINLGHPEGREAPSRRTHGARSEASIGAVGGLPGYFSSSFAPGGVGTSNTLRVTETNE